MLYVYAIIEHERGMELPLSGPGILPEAPLWALEQGHITAVVSPVPADIFGADALAERLAEASWARARVVAHERVVTTLLCATAVLPLKFGALFSDERALRAMLDLNRDRLASELARVRGGREWGVKLFFKEPPRAANTDTAIPGSGAAFFRRKREERLALEATEAFLAQCVAVSHQRLSERARAAVANRLQPRSMHGRTGEMLLNSAYLVDRAEEASWQAALGDLERAFGNAGFHYERTGPWGPYNFVGDCLVTS